MLVRVSGWEKTTVKPGDVITVSGYRARNGSPVLRSVFILKIGDRNPNATNEFILTVVNAGGV